MCQGLGPKKHDEISEVDRVFHTFHTAWSSPAFARRSRSPNAHWVRVMDYRVQALPGVVLFPESLQKYNFVDLSFIRFIRPGRAGHAQAGPGRALDPCRPDSRALQHQGSGAFGPRARANQVA